MNQLIEELDTADYWPKIKEDSDIEKKGGNEKSANQV